MSLKETSAQDDLAFMRSLAESAGGSGLPVAFGEGYFAAGLIYGGQMLLHAAQAMGLAPDSVAYVGDDLRDAQAARAAGMPMAVATWGYLGLGEPVQHWGADVLVDVPGQLADWLLARSATAA